MRLFYLSAVFIFCVSFYSCSKDDAGNRSTATGNNLGVGKSANDLLSAARYQSVKIEIAYMPGYQPDAASLTNLVNFLNTLINKPGGIQVVQRQIAASGKSTLTLDEIKAIETSNRTVLNSGNVLGLFILYADAYYAQLSTLGLAYKNTSMVIFARTVTENSGGIDQVSRTKLESVGLEHEFGHLLGLVNLGSTMQVNHEDSGHEKHCNNTACLMYYATQSNTLGGFILQGPVPELDANCKNDLRANGGK